MVISKFQQQYCMYRKYEATLFNSTNNLSKRLESLKEQSMLITKILFDNMQVEYMSGEDETKTKEKETKGSKKTQPMYLPWRMHLTSPMMRGK